jgi:hypothetical protein
MKYIMIFEDGTPYKANTITDTDKQANEDGVIQIIRLEDLKSLSQDNETWEDLKEWK